MERGSAMNLLPSSTVENGIDQGHEHVEIGDLGSRDSLQPARRVALFLDDNKASICLNLLDLMPRQQYFPVAHPLLVQTEPTKSDGLTCLVGRDVARPQ